jgi:seryl-tRNA synthetase
MSSPIAQTSVQNADKATKPRKPSLPEKYGKFIQFAYYMMDNVLGADFQMDKDAYLEKIQLFGSIEEQQGLVQGFFDAAKENKKTIKKVITDRNKAIAKANKPIKEKKSRAKKTTDDAVEEGTESPAKRSRAKASAKKVNTVQDELLNELVQLARDDVPTVTAETPPVANATPEPKATKPKSTKKSTGKKSAANEDISA